MSDKKLTTWAGTPLNDLTKEQCIEAMQELDRDNKLLHILIAKALDALSPFAEAYIERKEFEVAAEVYEEIFKRLRERS